MRSKHVIGNWKMNKTYSEGMQFLSGLSERLSKEKIVPRVGVAPPFLLLKEAAALQKGISICAQNCSASNDGALTGEVSASMLASIGVGHVIIGHSERRHIFGETDETISEKVQRALENGLTPILCVGEKLEERESGRTFEVITRQLEKGIGQADPKKIMLAYEPVWAIGTGRNATPEQAQEVHALIRKKIKDGGSVSILYGGSCNPKNARAIFAQPDVDGGLIGGASLVIDDFISVIRSF